jgi:hypothetical protein
MFPACSRIASTNQTNGEKTASICLVLLHHATAWENLGAGGLRPLGVRVPPPRILNKYKGFWQSSDHPMAPESASGNTMEQHLRPRDRHSRTRGPWLRPATRSTSATSARDPCGSLFSTRRPAGQTPRPARVGEASESGARGLVHPGRGSRSRSRDRGGGHGRGGGRGADVPRACGRLPRMVGARARRQAVDARRSPHCARRAGGEDGVSSPFGGESVRVPGVSPNLTAT